MSLQFDPRLLLEEAERKLQDTQNRLATVSSIVDPGITAYCNRPGVNCTVTSTRNRFTAFVREQVSLKETVTQLENSIRILKREIELRQISFTTNIDEKITELTQLQESLKRFTEVQQQPQIIQIQHAPTTDIGEKINELVTIQQSFLEQFTQAQPQQQLTRIQPQKQDTNILKLAAIAIGGAVLLG